MVDKIEMSLDDIIKANRSVSAKRGSNAARGNLRKKRGSGVFRNPQRQSAGVLKGRNRGGISRSRYSRGDVNSAWTHDMYDGPKRSSGGINKLTGLLNGSAKLLVSNLDYGVSESDIHELFADFGPLKSASVHYDRSGRSLGTADVVFERRADAVKAMKQYNGVPLDGRPMNIQLATSEVPVATLNKTRPVNPGIRSRAPLRRNQGRSGGNESGGRKRATKGPAPTAEELDAELDAYVNDMK